MSNLGVCKVTAIAMTYKRYVRRVIYQRIQNAVEHVYSKGTKKIEDLRIE